MFRHPDTGQCLPLTLLNSQPFTFTSDQNLNPFRPVENTNKPSTTPFVFREGPVNPNQQSFICQKPINSDFTSSMNNLSIKRENEKKENEKKENEKKENEKKEKEKMDSELKEKDIIIENLFAELIQMRTQIQTLSSAVDKMFTIVSKLKN
jgi:hypothetical protein